MQFKKFYFLLLLCSFCISVLAKDEAKKYYKYLHKAESAIIDDDFDKASINFSKAFEYLEYPFPNDLLAASICMLKSKNIDVELLRKWNYLYSIQTNTTIEDKIQSIDLYKGTLYHNKLTTKLWKDIIKKPNLNLVADTFVRDFFVEIHRKDQGIRREMDEKYGTQKYWIEDAKNKIIKVDSINLIKIDSIISLENFSEFMIGDFGTGTIFLSLLHNAAWQKEEVYEVSEKLFELVKKGRIDNRRFAHTFDRFCDFIDLNNSPKLECIKGYYFAENMYWIYEKHHTYLAFNNEELKVINKRRKEIYLTTVGEWAERLSYQIKKENLFFIKSNQWGSLPEEHLEKIEKLIGDGILIDIRCVY